MSIVMPSDHWDVSLLFSPSGTQEISTQYELSGTVTVFMEAVLPYCGVTAMLATSRLMSISTSAMPLVGDLTRISCAA
jgi:hypothetical protein